MTNNIGDFIDKTIWLAFLSLAIITPLLFSTQNTELFEVPKMIFVYFVATIIFFATIIKFVLQEKIIIPQNWVIKTFIIFVIIQILSTLTSVDKFTSVFGYPSRLNGGLLSQFAYFSIFACAIINLSTLQAKKLLIAIVLSAFAVSLWGIPSHFGRDPTCFILTGKLTSSCWQQEFNPKLRIFSTLGQPNWLAEYLVLTIPVSLALSLMATRIQTKAIFSLVTLTSSVAFILTNSRSGALGLTIALFIFIALIGSQIIKKNLKILAILITAFSLAGIFLGSKLLFRIDDTITIRQIVWQGAVEIFKKNPLLGTGPETFPYSYYRFRPLAHNQTAEWNFFYNKAHNEFLNYLANLGIAGTFVYIALLIFAANLMLKNAKSPDAVIQKATAAAIIGYQITIFFGFGTVTSQLVMFILIGCAISNIEKEQWQINLKIGKNLKYAIPLLVILVGLAALSFPIRLYMADILLNRAKNNESAPGKTLTAYQDAIDIFPAHNPFYLSEYSYSLALYLTTYETENQKQLVTRSVSNAKQAEELAPNNLIVLRKIANTYLLISSIDSIYEEKALQVGYRLPRLAPTDPQSYFSLAKIQAGLGKEDEAKITLEKTLKLKPDYQEAIELLDQLEQKELQ